MVTKLDVYQQAELHIGKSTITALTNEVEARYKFDQAWTGVVEEAFMEGDWNFAKKTSSLSASGAPRLLVGATPSPSLMIISARYLSALTLHGEAPTMTSWIRAGSSTPTPTALA